MPASPPHLLSPRGPWVHLLALPLGKTLDEVLIPPKHLIVRAIDARTCPTKDSLLHALAGAFAFPAYFDPNWDALDECLSDLDWLPGDGYLLVMTHADRLLMDHPQERQPLLRLLRSTGKEWSTKSPPKPFRTLLVVPTAQQRLAQEWRIARWPSE